MQKAAVIGIGSNSVRMLVVLIEEDGFTRLTRDREGTRLFAGLDNGSYVYFVHSYYLKAEDPSIVAATTEYSTHIHASVEAGNVFACQFHPEKSSEVGLQILKNFAQL